MSVSSIVVLTLVLALAVLAVWRNIKKGAPCECGGSCRTCGRKKDCNCGK
ncbi:MAG: FeoB-associated Cys-rich membrane protein [Kiritimatiellae bacterium]|nr:FeoB-associated Cys-rich membrane protein [Kiritimatiellia bacterium]